MRRTLTLLIFTFIGFYQTLNAQTPNWDWARSAGSVTHDQAGSICTDPNGNVFITGTFSSPIILGSTTLTSSGNLDAFIAKYDPSGAVLWATNVGGIAEDRGYGVSTDPNGNVYVVGTFFSPSITIGSTTLTKLGGTEVFIVKFDASGNIVWAKSAGGTSDEQGMGISTDANGNVFITGYFDSPTMTFGSITLSNIGGEEVFIAKYDSNGNELWAKSGGGISVERGSGISTDANGNVFITGVFSSPTITFGTASLTNVNSGGYDIFIVKFDSIGNLLWAESAGGNSSDGCSGISTDINGNVLITGAFNSATITFGTITLTNANAVAPDMFIAKYDPSGNVLWANRSGGNMNEGGYGITSDINGNVYLAGKYDGPSILFGPFSLTNVGEANSFITKYDTSGNVVWSTSVGGVKYDVATRISADLNGSVFITGSFSSPTIKFGNTTLVNSNTTSTYSYDIFISKISGTLSGIEDPGKHFDFSIAPNPTSGTLNIYLSNTLQQPSNFYVYDLLGSKVLETKLTSDKTTLDVSQLKNGVYFVSIVSGTNNIVKKFVKL